MTTTPVQTNIKTVYVKAHYHAQLDFAAVAAYAYAYAQAYAYAYAYACVSAAGAARAAASDTLRAAQAAQQAVHSFYPRVRVHRVGEPAVQLGCGGPLPPQAPQAQVQGH